MRVGNIVRAVYHEMQKHYPTFRILVWLKEKGITRRINYLLNKKSNDEAYDHPTETMLQSAMYYDSNGKSLDRVMQILADDKSRAVMGGVIDYRMNRTPLRNDLYSEHNQYFVEDIIQISDGEVFVDCGAYTGDTIQQFLDTAKKQHKRVKRIIGFEPDIENYKVLRKFYGKRNGIKLYNMGISSRKDTLYFINDGVVAHIVEDEKDATSKIEVINIDDVPECEEATWIKMDIEGAEWDALHGARETIIRNQPKLTICIYHSDEDMLRLAEYIHELVPEYKLFVRHHSKRDVETVLYAICG